MGAKSSKVIPELTGDERFLEAKDKRNIYFGPKWRKKYEFDGRLKIEKLELMMNRYIRYVGTGQRSNRQKGLTPLGCGCLKPGKEVSRKRERKFQEGYQQGENDVHVRHNNQKSQ
jgi:hypothetical protein